MDSLLHRKHFRRSTLDGINAEELTLLIEGLNIAAECQSGRSRCDLIETWNLAFVGVLCVAGTASRHAQSDSQSY
jgi:hypothetical protein